MGIEYRLVEGAGFAAKASALLQEAWKPPALHYSTEYMRWQLLFPGPCQAPAVAALDGSKLVGFAASTHRRVRFHSATVDVVVVSFVAVDPDSRNQGIAAGLYAHLLEAIHVEANRLQAIRKSGAPVITFGQAGSNGQHALERAYPQAGFELHSLGSYPVYGCVVKPGAPTLGWTLCTAGTESEALHFVLETCAPDNLLWSDPSESQICHYRIDPRGRHLLVERNDAGVVTGAAWAVRTEHVGPAGIGAVTSIDCAWVRRDRVTSLPSLAAAAAQIWPEAAQVQTIMAPSMLGFDSQAMRRLGFRQIAAGFEGYTACAHSPNPFSGATGTNLEVV